MNSNLGLCVDKKEGLKIMTKVLDANDATNGLVINRYFYTV